MVSTPFTIKKTSQKSEVHKYLLRIPLPSTPNSPLFVFLTGINLLPVSTGTGAGYGCGTTTGPFKIFLYTL